MEQDAADSIDFSVIVPTHDRPSQLAACLDALANLRYPRAKFEVIVVDDGSEVSAEPVVAPYRERLQVTFRSQPHGGPAQARNAGAKIGRGRFFAFTDDDCTPAPDWLDQLAAQLDGPSNRVVGGRTVNALSENVFATASQSLIGYLYDYYNADPKKAQFLVSCNLALSAGSFLSVGGFDPAYPRAAAEDRDLCERLRLRGHGMMYASEAVVYHRHPLNLSTFWRQHFGYGRGAWRFQRAHRGRSGQGLRIEPLPFYAGLAVHPFRQGGILRSRSVAALLLLSQVANVAGFLCEGVLQTTRRNPSSIR
jgi:GT2 family glycosyltransferase